MIKNTFRFWFVATLVLATVYLVSNPSMAGRLGSRISKLWQGVISRVVEAPTLLATVKPDERDELPESSKRGLSPVWEQPEQVVGPVLEEPWQQKNFLKEKASPIPLEKKAGYGKGQVAIARNTQTAPPTVPEVKLEDVLTPREEMPLTQASATSAVTEKAISLEVLKEIYARHLEALKILDSKGVDEQNDK